MTRPDFLWMPRRATAAMLAAGHEWLRNSINLDGAEMYNAMVAAHEASAQEPAPFNVNKGES